MSLRDCIWDCDPLRTHDDHKCRTRQSFYRWGTQNLLWLLVLLAVLL